MRSRWHRQALRRPVSDADDIARILSDLTPIPAIKVVDLPDLPDGGDIVEWIEAHGDAAEPGAMRQELDALADDAAPTLTPKTTPALERFEPFPVDVLPEPLRGFTSAGAKAIGCDATYIALPLLTVTAAAIGNSRCLQLKRGWYAPAILWSAIVGESGTAKTPAFRLAMRRLRERQRKALAEYAEDMRRHEANLARHEKGMSEWKRDKNAIGDPPRKPEAPQATRYIVSDTTVEALAPLLLANPRGVLMACDELSQWFGSFDRYAGGKSGRDAGHWLSMFNGESVTVDRRTGNPPTIHVPRASVSICGGIQPTILNRALGTEHRESGLAARLLLACPPRVPKQWTEADIDPLAEAKIARLLDRLYELELEIDDNGELRPKIIVLSREAKAAWTRYYNDHAREQAELTGELSAAWSKLEEYAARLALLIHFARWAANDTTLASADILDEESMAAGIRLATWFKREICRVYAILDESDGDREQRRMIEWVERKGGSVTGREVQMGCRWLRKAGAAEEALESLVKAGFGKWEPTPPGKRGQPTRKFCLSHVNGNRLVSDGSKDSVDVDAAADRKADMPDDEWGKV